MAVVRIVAACVLFWLASAAAGGELRRQLLAEPESLDPQLITGETDFDVVEDLFEGLTAQGPDGNPVPGAAVGWETSADRLSWTFHLRPGLAWSDGAKLTAADFVWAMRRAVDPATASPYAAALAPFANAREIIAGAARPETLGVSAPDPATVLIRLVEPTPFLPGLLFQPVTYPLPQAAVARWGRAWTRPGHMVSNGAFRLSQWTPQFEIVLEPNPSYHDRPPALPDRVRWILADDRKAGLRRFRAGELDTAALAAEDYSWAVANDKAELHSTPLFATRYLVFNLANGPFAGDVRLREALSRALDRDLLIGKLDTRGQRPAWGFIPPGLAGYHEQSLAYRNEPPETRAVTARRLFAEARGANTSPLRITLIAERNDVDDRLSAAIRAIWQQALPVQVTLDRTEWQVFNAAFHRGDFEVALFGWYADYADPWNFLANFRSDAGPLNPGAYRSTAFDALLDRARRGAEADRLTTLAEAERQLLADHPIAPLEFVVDQRLVAARVHGWTAEPFNMNLSRYLSAE
ncbi:MAG TPA: peptide ABC transporter substrate-binding protein [Stellaceae bacterium]|nr:peptide ABC transporter substrate-binding protein [Stellaceae bacterium]